MAKTRVHWGAKTPPKGRPTPKRLTPTKQREANRKAAEAAREADPNLRRLYEAFSPPPRGA